MKYDQIYISVSHPLILVSSNPKVDVGLKYFVAQAIASNYFTVVE